MNRVILMGRLTQDVKLKEGDNAVARYTLAVDRQFKRDGEAGADFISCVAFGKSAEFAGKYLHKGIKIAIEGRIQTGKYQNKDGQTVYTTDVIVDRHEFCESKGTREETKEEVKPVDNDFMNIPEGVDEELPFG